MLHVHSRAIEAAFALSRGPAQRKRNPRRRRAQLDSSGIRRALPLADARKARSLVGPELARVLDTWRNARSRANSGLPRCSYECERVEFSKNRHIFRCARLPASSHNCS
jgi:hypothetical protein